MIEYEGKDIRNVVLLGHAGSGKSTFIESALLLTNEIDRMGNSSDGSLAMDYDPEEAKRGLSVYSSIAPIQWKGRKINFIDTPGYLDYEGDMVSGASVADLALIFVSGKEGQQSGTEKAANLAIKLGIPICFLINNADEGIKFEEIAKSLTDVYGRGAVPFLIPEMDGNKMIGVRNTIYEENDPYYNEIMEVVASANDEMMEKFFAGETFTKEEKKFGLKQALRNNEIKPILGSCAISGYGVGEVLSFICNFAPVHCEKGTIEVDGKSVETKDDAPFTGRVFKTVVDPFVGKISYLKIMSGSLSLSTPLYNANKDANEKAGALYVMCGKKQQTVDKAYCGDIVALTKLSQTETCDTLCTKDFVVKYPPIEYPRPMLGMAISPKTKDDEDKMSDALKKILIEDKSINLVRNAETGEQVLYCVGDQQLDVVVNKLKNRYKVEINLKEPKVQYRETIRGKSEVQGKYKKQNGGAGQFGDVWVRFEYNPDEEDLVFAEEVFGGAVPKNFFPSVEAGLRACMAKGPLAGCKVVNVKATLYDGSYHPVDSKPNSFEAAAKLAFKNGIPKANPMILEPIGKVHVVTPEKYVGDLIGDFNKRRGMIMDTGHTDDGYTTIDADVPMAEMLKYATELRSMTKGRGTYVIDFDRYEPAPNSVAEKVIAAAAKDLKDDDID